MPASQVAYMGNSTTFQCHYRDGSQDKVTWLKKGGSLPNGRHSVDNGALTITEIELQDEGTYVCQVNTGEREITVEADLDVQCKWLSLKHGHFPLAKLFGLRMVPTSVTVHTFCASRDTQVCYGWCLLIQGYFCAV